MPENKRYIRIHPNVSGDIFGCAQAYFDRLIKGKDLEVINSYSNHYVVRDDDFQTWYVPTDIADLVPESKEVSHV